MPRASGSGIKINKIILKFLQKQLVKVGNVLDITWPRASLFDIAVKMICAWIRRQLTCCQSTDSWIPKFGAHFFFRLSIIRNSDKFDSFKRFLYANEYSSLVGLKAPSSAPLISRYILRLGQRGHCCFCATCPNRKMYLGISEADEGLLRYNFLMECI